MGGRQLRFLKQCPGQYLPRGLRLGGGLSHLLLLTCSLFLQELQAPQVPQIPSLAIKKQDLYASESNEITNIVNIAVACFYLTTDVYVPG